MYLRMKDRYFTGLTRGNNYHPDEPVLPGSALEEERKALNAKHGTVSDAEFEKLRVATYKGFKKVSHCPPLLTMKLQHGDMVVMHGAEMQKYYEVSRTFRGT